MPNRTIYLLEKDVEKFDKITNKSQWIRDALNGKTISIDMPEEKLEKLMQAVVQAELKKL